jgi:hypothetical protein
VYNSLEQSLKTKLVTGGALAGAGAYVDFDGKNVIGEIIVGTGAQVTARGGLEFEVDGFTKIYLQSYSETFGAATVALGYAKADVVPINRIKILANAKLISADDMYLSAGTDRDLNLPEHSLEMRVDNFAGSVIPISDLETRALYEAHNLIQIDSGASIDGYANIDLNADGFNIASVVGVAKATSWASALGNALGGGSVGSGAGATRSVIMGDVINNGTITTGAQRAKSLTLIVNSAGDTVIDTTRSSMTTQDGVTTSDITFTAGRATLSSAQFTNLATARSNIQTYADNATLVTFYTNQVTRIEADLLAQGLAARMGDGTIVAMTPDVDTVTIGRVKAAAGRVRIFADQLSGTGTINVPKNASITINSESFAQLVIADIEIPDTNGGIYFNGTDITAIGETTTSVATALAWVNAENVRNRNSNNNNLANIGASDVTKTAGFNVTAASIDRTSSMPLITISVSNINNFVNRTTGELPPPQEIRVTGSIIARTSRLSITNPSNNGTITVLGQIATAELSIAATSAVSISGAVVYQVGGDPYGQFLNSGMIGDGSTAANSTPARIAQFNAWLAANPTTPSIMSNRITISAEFLDVNGLIQSGKQDYTLVLGAAQKTQIDRARASGSNYTNITVDGNSDFTLIYNRQADALTVKALRPTGGYIELTGNIMNSRNGKVTAYSGYPQVTITNNMALPGLDLTFESIDADLRGDGIVKINDKARSLTTIYTKLANGNVQVDTINFGSSSTATNTISDSNLTYNPVSGYRYAWSVGVSSRTKQTAKWSESGWLGIIDLGSTNIPVAPVTQQLNAELVPNSNYYYRNTGLDGNAYTYSANTVTTSSTGWKQTQYSVKKSWYGKKTYTYEYQKVDGLFTTNSHTIEADRPIGISFLHNTAGNIIINAGSADIVITGKLTNKTGTTSLTTTGSITTSASLGGTSLASVGGKTVNLTAGGSIGSALSPLQTDLADGISGTVLNATAGGDIHLYEVDGDFNIGTVSAVKNSGTSTESRGTISIYAAKSILGGSSSLISGGAIILTAKAGTIGTASQSLRIDTGTLATHTITATSTDDMFISEISGDLRVSYGMSG